MDTTFFLDTFFCNRLKNLRGGASSWKGRWGRISTRQKCLFLWSSFYFCATLSQSSIIITSGMESFIASIILGLCSRSLLTPQQTYQFITSKGLVSAGKWGACSMPGCQVWLASKWTRRQEVTRARLRWVWVNLLKAILSKANGLKWWRKWKFRKKYNSSFFFFCFFLFFYLSTYTMYAKYFQAKPYDKLLTAIFLEDKIKTLSGNFP